MPRKSILEFFFEKTDQNVEMSYELNYKVEKVNKQNKKIDIPIPPELEDKFLKQFGIKAKKMDDEEPNMEEQPIRKILIYTDGSCLKNPGKGGWAFIFINKNNDEIHMSDYEENTTNNRMEMKAVIEGLKFLENNEKCIIYSDSLLVINCATNKWKRKSNLDLWKEYDKVSINKTIEFNWIKGHSGNEYNEKVDKMAFSEAKNC